jgi:tetratricopeptide (TPR) repeat protein
MVLAEEGATRIFRMEAHRRAGAELRAAGQPQFALEQYEKALDLEPRDVESRRQRGMLLGKLGRHDEAMACFEAILEDEREDPETLAYVGRLEKDAWTAEWRTPGRPASDMRQAAADADAWLRRAIDWYARAFSAQTSHYYSGVNALALAHLLLDLTGGTLPSLDSESLAGAVRWAATSAVEREQQKFWPLVTLGDLEVLVGDRPAVERAYRDAIAAAEKDRFALSSSREQLLLLRDLGFRPDEVGAALALFDRALAKLDPPAQAFTPGRVLLFSGHMIDAQGRPEPRFPPDREPIAAKAIEDELDRLKAGPGDLGLCGGACGGDLLFAEAILRRGAHLDIRIPFPEGEFFQRSVSFEKSGPATADTWGSRFQAAKASGLTRVLVMPAELGPTPPDRDPYERLNLWQLYTALAHGPDKVHAVLLWNRQGGDGPGGTRHMHDEVSRRTGQVSVLDTRRLWR